MTYFGIPVTHLDYLQLSFEIPIPYVGYLITYYPVGLPTTHYLLDHLLPSFRLPVTQFVYLIASKNKAFEFPVQLFWITYYLLNMFSFIISKRDYHKFTQSV